MNELIEYDKFEGTPVHRITIEDVVYWFASDVCFVAGIKNVSQAVNGGGNSEGLDDDEKLRYTMYMSGQRRQKWLVNQAGLNGLLMAGKKEVSKRLRRWLRHEVLPAIQNTGAYTAPQTREERLAIAVIDAQAWIKELKPKAELADRFLLGTNALSLSGVAKSLGHKPHKFIERLRKDGMLRRLDGQNVPTSYYMDQGYFIVRQVPRLSTSEGVYKNYPQTLVTAKGQAWLAKRYPLENQIEKAG